MLLAMFIFLYSKHTYKSSYTQLFLFFASSLFLARSLSLYQNSDEPPPEGGGGGGDLTDADIDSNWEETIETFDAMGLPEELLRGIYAYGFEKPSAIQQRAIKPTMLGRDLIAQAQSGTVSCTIGVLASLDLCFVFLFKCVFVPMYFRFTFKFNKDVQRNDDLYCQPSFESE